MFTREHYEAFSSRIIANAEYCDRVATIDSMAFPLTLSTFPAEIESSKVCSVGGVVCCVLVLVMVVLMFQFQFRFLEFLLALRCCAGMGAVAIVLSLIHI